VASIETVQKIIAEWTQLPCPPMLESGRPIVSVKVSQCRRGDRGGGVLRFPPSNVGIVVLRQALPGVDGKAL